MQAQARLGLIANWVAPVLQLTTTPHDLFAVADEEARRRLPTGFNVDDMAQVSGMSRIVFTREYTVPRLESPGVYLRLYALKWQPSYGSSRAGLSNDLRNMLDIVLR